MKNILNQKTLSIFMLLSVSLSNALACEIYNVKSGDDYVYGNADQCNIIPYGAPINFVGAKTEAISYSKKIYNWKSMTQAQKNKCLKFQAAIPVTTPVIPPVTPPSNIWKTYSSRGYATIPSYRITNLGKGKKTKFRIKAGLPCDSRVVKLVKKNFQYMGIHSNGAQVAVYCRRAK